MAFSWKDKKDMYKGEGIYHLTFGIVNRKAMLGTLRPLEIPDSMGHIAWTEATELGKAVYHLFNHLPQEYPQMQILRKQIMPNHFHAVVWMHEGFEGSIKMVARGFAQGCSKVARRLEAERRAQLAGSTQTAVPWVNAQSNCAVNDGTEEYTAHQAGEQAAARQTEQGYNKKGEQASRPQSASPTSYECGNGANTLFEKPFVRTLAHSGQLQAMIHYVHTNPDSAWMRRMHPEMYVIRRHVERAGLHFDMMGKMRLLDWPDRQVIALSRSLTQEQIAEEVRKALRLAESGTVTYTAAINAGEKAVAKAVREAGYPLVVMMLDGFPPEGSEAARYYHPGGVYHKACGDGQLLLMAPLPENYQNEHLIALTEDQLYRKALEKGRHYTAIPHESRRWRMIAGNVMLQSLAQ